MPCFPWQVAMAGAPYQWQNASLREGLGWSKQSQGPSVEMDNDGVLPFYHNVMG